MSNHAGEFFDGQSLICGCPGLVSVDEDGDVWINNGDAECPKCADQLSVVLSSLQVTEEEDVTRNVEAVLTPGDQLPHRPTEGNS
jgi:hypothetical protein